MLPGLLPQVEGDAALVSADALPDQPDIIPRVAPRAERVTGAGLLDLDNIGPHLAQGGGDQRPGHQRRRVDYPDTLQCRRADRAVRHRYRRRLKGSTGRSPLDREST